MALSYGFTKCRAFRTCAIACSVFWGHLGLWTPPSEPWRANHSYRCAPDQNSLSFFARSILTVHLMDYLGIPHSCLGPSLRLISQPFSSLRASGINAEYLRSQRGLVVFVDS